MTLSTGLTHMGVRIKPYFFSECILYSELHVKNLRNICHTVEYVLRSRSCQTGTSCTDCIVKLVNFYNKTSCTEYEKIDKIIQ